MEKKKKQRQLTIEEKWSKDDLPNVTPPTAETLAWVEYYLREERNREADRTRTGKTETK
jgi:hypothetical protein